MLELKSNNSVSAYNLISKDWGKTFVFCLIAVLTEFIPFFGRMLLFGISIKVMSNAMKNKLLSPARIRTWVIWFKARSP